MKNKLLISLLLIVSSYLTYSLFFKSPEISNISSKNNGVLSNDTSTFNSPIQQSPKTKENTSTSVDSNTSSTANLDNKTITVPNFLSSLKCTNYVLKSGETLTQIARKYQNTYDVSSITKLLVYINDLPNNDLPLGESIFLPLI